MFGKRPVQREFEEVVLPHLGALYAMALRLCRHERDAEDLVQDTVLKAFRFFRRFEKGTNCKAWLFKILTNTFLNRYQKGSREREVVREVELGDHYDQFLSQDASHVQDPEHALLGRMLSDDVARALTALPDEFRMAVLLSDIEEFSYKEIADIMGCPIGTVMSRLYRGRRLLQKALYHYAVEAGVIQPVAEAPFPAPAVASAAGEKTIDLAAYRRRRDGTI